MALASLAATKQKANSDLLEAAKDDDELKVVAALAQPGVDVNCCDDEGYDCRTPLLLACKLGNLRVFRILLEDHRVDVNARDTQGRTVLHLWKTEYLVKKILLSERTDIDWNAADMIGQTPLLWFARMGAEESVRRLIGVESVNLFATTIDGFTALHQVAERKTPFPYWATPGDISDRCNIVDLVLEEVGRRGHNVVSFVDATDILNRSALHYIAEEGCIEILEKLCKFSANMNVNVNASNPDNLKPFEEPQSWICRPKLFLEIPEAQPSRDLTPLHFAVMDGRMEVVRLLLEREGINIDPVDSAGLTPLQYSVQNGHWEIVEFLLKKGKPFTTLNIHAVDSAGRTPLHFAVTDARMEGVRLLLEWEGININAVDSAGRTPLHFAVMDGRMEVVRLLLEREGINLDPVDSAGLTPLHYSVQNGPWKMVQLLLKKGKPFATLDYDRQCDVFEDLLHLATKREEKITAKIIAIQLLSTLGSRMNVFADISTNSPAINPLAMKAERDVATMGGRKRGHVEAVQELLEHPKLDVNAEDNKKMTPLLYAIEAGNVDMVKVLYEKDKFNRLNIDAVDNAGRTPLHFAVMDGRMKVVRLLLEWEGINIDAVDNAGCTPLHIAVTDGRMEVVRLLLEQEGINIDAMDIAGLTPLHYSVQNGHWKMVQLLLKKGKPFATFDYDRQCDVFEDLLHLATKREEKTIAIQLLNTLGFRMNAFAGISTRFFGNQSFSNQSRLLAFAAVSNHFEIIKYIVKWQPEVNVNERSEWAVIPGLVATPLHFAVVERDVATVGGRKRGHVEVVQELLEHPKLDVNAEDNKKMTPLMYAIEASNVDMVKVLYEKDKFNRLNIDAVDNAGLTPLQYSVQNGHWEIVELLLKKGKPFATLNIDAVDSAGRTPLHCAVMDVRMEVVRLLLEWEGIKIDAVDSAGLTPLHYSVQNGHSEMVELLLKKGKPFATLDYDRQCNVFKDLLCLATEREEKTIAIQLLNKLGSRMKDFADIANKFSGDQSFGDQSRLLALGAVSNHFEIIKYIVKWQPEVNVNEKSKWAAIPGLVATPLHFAAVAVDVPTVGGPERGHVEALKELLKHPTLDVNAEDNTKMTPLLYAIKARNVDMVKALCQNDIFNRLRANEENPAGKTPLQIVVEDNNLSENPNLKAIEKVLLERPEVKDFVDRLYRDRQVFVDAANALLVGAALIASVTFAGWLQPPLGYTPYYDFSQPFPAPPGAYESYAAIKQNPKVKAFWVFNSLSFFFSIATVLAGADAAMPSLDDAFIGRVVKSVRTSLILASILLVMSVVCVLGAFASGGLAVLPPVLKYDTSMIITVCVGGTVCMIILAKFLRKLAKAIHIQVQRGMKPDMLVGVDHQLIGNGS
ncbi:hypothetical protein CY35_02G189700 [Sphagnum magellanicum]|nr:hypothetical protein CY35_02G189700 [Sphagnum magellanicum]